MKELRRLVSDDRHAEAWQRLRELAATTTSYSGLRSLGRLIGPIEDSGAATGLLPRRIALVGGGTPGFVADPLRAACAGSGILATIHVGGYGEFPGGLLDTASELAAFEPHVVFVLNTAHDLLARIAADTGAAQVDAIVAHEVGAMLAAAKSFHERTAADVVFHTLPVPNESRSAPLAWKLASSAESVVARFNLELGARASGHVHLIDNAGMAARMGTRQWFDPRFWYHAKQPMAFGAVPAWTAAASALLRGLLGRTRKVAVLDLDDTLWGGVVGDDGIAGLRLGEGTGEGEAFKAFQGHLKRLQQLGVLLAVCSKNEEAIALDAIERHPEMLLRKADFVAIRANWRPKSDNIREIARQLDLGLDSFVFVDDNPAEREQVRRELPEVAVPDMGDEPANYAAILSDGHFFDQIGVTAEDAQRTDAYRARAEAFDSLETASDLSSYLRSLEMIAAIRPFDALSLERITQLTNKTNQFNLTTRRVSRAEVEQIAEAENWIALSVRLRDRFGDHGLIGVFFGEVADRDGQRVLTIEAWLMSCRVLKRGVESALFEVVLEAARARGVDRLIGIYRPSDRNAIVADLYAELGFTRSAETCGEVRWELPVADAKAPPHFVGLE